jgi:hypothetical protein
MRAWKNRHHEKEGSGKMEKTFDILMPLLFVALVVGTLSLAFALPSSGIRDDTCDDDWTRAAGAHKGLQKNC